MRARRGFDEALIHPHETFARPSAELVTGHAVH
jgi:hypothetical protein